MSGLDIEGVLAGHRYITFGYCGGCDWMPPDVTEDAEPYPDQHRAHVAAVLREQIAAWLVDAETIDLAYDVRDRTGKTGEVLTALAAQVAPSRVPGEGS